MDHDMVHKLKVIGQRIWLFGQDIFKKPSEKHGIRESHFATLSHTYHSMSDIVSKIEMFVSGETIEHVTQGCIGVIFVTGEAYGIFTNDDVPLLEFISLFDVDHLKGVEDNVFSFDFSAIRKCTHTHTHTFTRNFENLSKVFESESGFNIVDDESNGESSIEVLNEANTFVKLKNEDGENLFINDEKAIKTNCRKDVAKIWFVIEEVRKDDLSFVKESIYERLVNFPFFTGKAFSTMIHGDVVGGVMMINVG
ncbi:hypothetical protein Tco_0481187 [Tanacetum coccineum]